MGDVFIIRDKSINNVLKRLIDACDERGYTIKTFYSKSANTGKARAVVEDSNNERLLVDFVDDFWIIHSGSRAEILLKQEVTDIAKL